MINAGKGGGVIQGRACEAILVVMLAARKRVLTKVSVEQGISEAEALGKLIVYTSDQAHSCVHKASQVHNVASYADFHRYLLKLAMPESAIPCNCGVSEKDNTTYLFMVITLLSLLCTLSLQVSPRKIF